MNKKAQMEIGVGMPYMIIAMFVLTAMFIMLLVLFSTYTSAPVATHEEAYILVYKQRFLDSPDCFAYEDIDTGNIYPGIIDKSKFTESNLNNCYKENIESHYEFSLTLQEGETETTISTQNYKQLKKKIPTFVLINDNGELKKGTLFVSVSVKE
ncbi:hypothetical protein ACFLZ7_03065 [Nanoarchaeota archaeon]